ncbi:MAG: type II toxin-antitoxin system RelE/ParE family toxin [Halobacteriota archaeon]|nr:type II toxin-antitoxin system RelE/ParE family toxin [Halobacteriota archaeon]
MTYEVVLSKKAFNQLKKLDKTTQERIFKALDRIRIRPEKYVQKLVGSSEYRLRVGDYRLILDIDKEKIRIIVLKIGHRKNIYD